MRATRFHVFVVVPALAIGPSIAACAAIDSLGTSGGAAHGDAGAGEGGAGEAGPSVAGQGCGVEGETGLTLCRSTSQCPNVVVDSAAFPHCGFRVRGSAVDLVCACGQSLCSMGAFLTCPQAGQLLVSQTETSICTEVADGRCTAIAPPAPSSSASSGPCDRQCLSECGGGGACASMCGCP